MRKLFLIIVLLVVYSCGSIHKEDIILKKNYVILKKKYPDAVIYKYRNFDYIFMVDCKKVKVLKSGEVINIK